MNEKFYLGWDVGAWRCKPSSKSCDALVILNENAHVVGSPFRNSLKNTLNEANDTQEILTNLFNLCGLNYKGEEVVMAIDTPLGYSEAFVKLISDYTSSHKIPDDYKNNPYLFRKTEKHVFEANILRNNGKVVRPLSAVNDMIGAQSTKGIHFLAKFSPIIYKSGIWKSNCEKLTILETYPSVNREITIPIDLNYNNDDIKDAYICAKMAYIFDKHIENLEAPSSDIPEKEGWIWYLKK